VLSTLRAAGPDRGCWSWWGGSQTPQTSGAVARRRVQEAAVHTYDAQITLGAPQPLPDEVALDGVGEFLSTFCATTIAWPHKPAVLDLHAIEGRSWRLTLSADGARATRLPAGVAGPDAADASVRGTASEVLLTLYDRIPVDSLQLDDDRRLWDQLRGWNPGQ
jgi:hypothetical protein